MDDMWWGQNRNEEHWVVRWLFRIVGSGLGVMLILLLLHNLSVSDDNRQKEELRRLYSNTLDYDLKIYYGFIQKIDNHNYSGLKAGGYGLYRVNQRSYNYCDYPEGDVSRMFFGSSNLEYEKMMIDNAMEMLCSKSQKQKLLGFLKAVEGKEEQLKKEFEAQYKSS